MKNRKLLLIVSLVLALTMSLGGTLAYLTDTDEAVNVMTLGNVKIEQLELQRKDGIDYRNKGEIADGDELETFEQGQALYPAYAADKSYYSAKIPNDEQFWWGPYVTADVSGQGSSNGLWDDDLVGAIDKFVFVKNTGTSDAYFRTWLAFECPISLEYDPDHVKDLWINANLNSRFTWSEDFYTEIEGVRYLVMCVTYNQPLAAGEIARPSLLQVALSEYADNEDMEALGSTYEILALTQAVQTNNMPDAVTALNAAFGAVAADNHPWVDVDGDGDVIPELPITVAKDAAELQAALEKGGNVILAADITVEDGFMITDKDVTIDLNGKTITTSEGASTNNRVFKITGSSNVTIKNGTLIAEGDKTSGAYGTIRTEGSANVTLDNVKLYNSRGNGLSIKALAGTTVTINNSTITATNGGGVEAAGGTVILNDTTINQNGAYDWCSTTIGVNSEGKAVVNSGTYTANTADTWVAYVMNSGGTLEINGGAFNGANTTGILCADRAAVVSINGGNFNSAGAILGMCNNLGTLPNPVATLKGGTFSADPRVSGLYASNLIKVADGYTATPNADGTWTVK